MDLNTSAPDTGTVLPPSSAPSSSVPSRDTSGRFDQGQLSETERRSSVRKSLDEAFERHGVDPRTGRQLPDERKEAAGEQERPAPGQATAEPEEEEVSKDARAPDRGEAGDASGSASGDIDEEADEAPSTREVEAPSSWSKEAKELWDSLPERARAEIAKREKDVEKGVKALKDKYKEIDDAFTPYDQTIQRFDKTRGQAVAQLFSWFNALAENPRDAFPALIESYKYDPRQIVEHYWPGALQRYAQLEQYVKNVQQQQAQPQQQQITQQQWNQMTPEQQQQYQQRLQQQQTQPQQQQPIVHPQVAQYIKQLEQKLTGLEQQVTHRFTTQDQYYEQQNAARTSEYLDQWSKDKPYFDRVRMRMGYYLTPGPDGKAVVPLKDGKVDLDGAYQEAIWADPDIRNEMIEQQRQERVAKAKAAREAKEKAAQEEVDRARRASGSITSSAPGAEISRKPSSAMGKSIRESITEAFKEHSSR